MLDSTGSEIEVHDYVNISNELYKVISIVKASKDEELALCEKYKNMHKLKTFRVCEEKQIILLSEEEITAFILKEE